LQDNYKAELFLFALYIFNFRTLHSYKIKNFTEIRIYLMETPLTPSPEMRRDQSIANRGKTCGIFLFPRRAEGVV